MTRKPQKYAADVAAHICDSLDRHEIRDLLAEAFKAGYEAGLRDAKREEPK